MHISQGAEGSAAVILGSDFQACGRKLHDDLNIAISSFPELGQNSDGEKCRGWEGCGVNAPSSRAVFII